MHILILANNDVGLYKFRKELLECLLKEHKVTIALPGGECIPALTELGCIFCPVDIDRRGTNPIRDLKLLGTYLKLLGRIKPDVVLTYTIKPNIYGGLACRLCRIPYMANITGLGTTFERGGAVEKLVTVLYRAGLKKAACVFFQNEHNREILQKKGIAQGRTRVVSGSGVNLEAYPAREYRREGGVEFLYVGRIMQEKGIEEFMETAAAFHDQARFSVLGYCEEAYEETMKQLSKEGILTYFGFDTRVQPYLERSSALILPSYHEGMSNVILEAASMARPVLASDISGCREAVENKVTGFLFEPKSKEALKEAVRSFLVLSVDEREQMGICGRRKMEREFDRQKVISAYIEEIEQLL